MTDFTINAQLVLNALHLAVDGSNIPLAQVEQFIDRAIATVENELNVTLGEMSGDEGSKTINVDKKYEPVIVTLAAIHCVCYMTSGSAVGLNFSLGDINVSVLSNAPPLSTLENQLILGLEGLKRRASDIPFVVGEAES